MLFILAIITMIIITILIKINKIYRSVKYIPLGKWEYLIGNK